MDTDSLFLALSERNLEDIILPEKNEWEAIRLRDCTDSFTVNATGNFLTSSREHVVLLKRSMIRESRDYIKKNSGVQKCCPCIAKPIVATIERVTSANSVARDSIKELWRTVEMDSCHSIAMFWKRQSTILQPIEDFERFSVVLLRMNKRRKDCLTFIRNE